MAFGLLLTPTVSPFDSFAPLASARTSPHCFAVHAILRSVAIWECPGSPVAPYAHGFPVGLVEQFVAVDLSVGSVDRFLVRRYSSNRDSMGGVGLPVDQLSTAERFEAVRMPVEQFGVPVGSVQSVRSLGQFVTVDNIDRAVCGR